MSEELTMRAKASVGNCIMSIKADEYVRFVSFFLLLS